MKELYEKTAFVNEIALVLSLHPKFKGLYKQSPDTFQERLSKAFLDSIALLSIIMLSVEIYREKKNVKDAFATGFGTLLAAYIIPNMFLEEFLRFSCKNYFSVFNKKCSYENQIGIALLFLYGLYKAEHPSVKFIQNII